jgi:HEAT repeat protein
MLATLLALLPAVLHFTSQESKPNDPAALLDRAKIAEELGDLPTADRLLASAAAAGDPKIAAAARARRTAIDRKLGRAPGDGAQTKPAASDGRSPMDRRFADALQRYLEESIDHKQFSEVLALVGAGALPQIRALIDDPSTRLAWMDKLFGMLGEVARLDSESAEPIQALRHYAASDDPLIRRKAIKTLAGIHDPRQSWSRALAGEFIQSPESDARLAALYWFQSWPADVDPHLSRLTRDPDPMVRVRLVRTFASRLSDADREALFQDRNDTVRREIVAQALNDQWPKPVEALLRLCQDTSEEVAHEAIVGLNTKGIGTTNPAAVLAILAKLEKSPFRDVRSQLSFQNRAVREIGAPAIPIVLAMVNDDDTSIATTAAQSLGLYPESAYSRANIPALCDAFLSMSRRFGVRHQETGPSTPADSFADRLASIVNRIATKDDFLTLVRILSSTSDLPRFHTNLAASILKKAGVEHLAILAQELERSGDPGTRAMLLERAVDLSASNPKEGEAALLPMLRAAIAQEQDLSLRVAGMLGVMKLGIRSLQSELLAALDAVSPSESLVASAVTMYGRAPRESVAVLLKLARRFAAEKDRSDGCNQIMGGLTARVTVDDLEAITNFLLDDEWFRYYTAFGDSHTKTRALCSAMAKLDKQGGVEALEKVAVSSRVTRVRVAAILALGNLNNPPESVIQFLVSRSSADTEPDAREACFSALQSLQHYDETTFKALEGSVRDPNNIVRLRFADYLMHWSDPKSIALWRELVKDSDVGVRIRACEGLGHFMVDDAVPELLELLADPIADVRAKAKDVLERIRFYNEEKKRWQDWKRAGGQDPAEGIQRLVIMIYDNDPAVRLAAIQSLGSMKAKEALPKLVDLLKKASGSEREEIARAIAKISQ